MGFGFGGFQLDAQELRDRGFTIGLSIGPCSAASFRR